MHAGSLGSHAAVEQLQPLADQGASPAEDRPTQGATPAASANVAASLPLGCPPLHRAARPGSSGMRTRPSAPPFASGPAHSSRGAVAAAQNGTAVQQNGVHELPRYTGSSPLQTPPVRSPNQAMAHDSPPVQDADLHTGVRNNTLCVSQYQHIMSPNSVCGLNVNSRSKVGGIKHMLSAACASLTH